MHCFVLSDPSRCLGCRACEIACVEAHMDEDLVQAGEKGVPFAPRLRIIHEVEVTAPVQCRQCEDAPCAAVCPVQAIVHDGRSVHVDADRCFGCKACMEVCPVGAIQVGRLPGEISGLRAYKCDLCSERSGGPACISVCPAGALRMLGREELREISGGRRRQRALQTTYTHG